MHRHRNVGHRHDLDLPGDDTPYFRRIQLSNLHKIEDNAYEFGLAHGSDDHHIEEAVVSLCIRGDLEAWAGKRTSNIELPDE